MKLRLVRLKTGQTRRSAPSGSNARAVAQVLASLRFGSVMPSRRNRADRRRDPWRRNPGRHLLLAVRVSEPLHFTHLWLPSIISRRSVIP